MSKFSPGDEIMLRTERTGAIKSVAKDSDSEKDCIYIISMHAGTSMKEIRIPGGEILRLLTDTELNRLRYKINESEAELLDTYKAATFKEWNRALRENTKEFADDISLFQRILTKLPKWSSAPVFRGLKFATAEQLNSFLAPFVNPDFEDYLSPQFMSTSPDITSAQRHSAGPFGVIIKILVSGQEGAPVRSVTKNSDLGVKEVFFKYGVYFTILHCAESTEKNGPKYSIVIGEKGAKIDPIEASTWTRKGRT